MWRCSSVETPKQRDKPNMLVGETSVVNSNMMFFWSLWNNANRVDWVVTHLSSVHCASPYSCLTVKIPMSGRKKQNKLSMSCFTLIPTLAFHGRLILKPFTEQSEGECPWKHTWTKLLEDGVSILAEGYWNKQNSLLFISFKKSWNRFCMDFFSAGSMSPTIALSVCLSVHYT